MNDKTLKQIHEEITIADWEMRGGVSLNREALALQEVILIATKRLIELGFPASEPLWQIVQGYYEHRGLKMPDTSEAYLFLVSEVGELADSLVSRSEGWVRNNARDRATDKEIGDVLMMLLVVAKTAGIDPINAMADKMAEKGYDCCLASGTSGT